MTTSRHSPPQHQKAQSVVLPSIQEMFPDHLVDPRAAYGSATASSSSSASSSRTLTAPASQYRYHDVHPQARPSGLVAAASPHSPHPSSSTRSPAARHRSHLDTDMDVDMNAAEDDRELSSTISDPHYAHIDARSLSHPSARSPWHPARRYEGVRGGGMRDEYSGGVVRGGMRDDEYRGAERDEMRGDDLNRAVRELAMGRGGNYAGKAMSGFRGVRVPVPGEAPPPQQNSSREQRERGREGRQREDRDRDREPEHAAPRRSYASPRVEDGYSPRPASSPAVPVLPNTGASVASPNAGSAASGPAGGKKHICPTCHKRFNRPSSLRIHLNTHTGATPFRCPFPNCGREFNVNSNMRRHLRNHGAAAPSPHSTPPAHAHHAGHSPQQYSHRLPQSPYNGHGHSLAHHGNATPGTAALPAHAYRAHGHARDYPVRAGEALGPSLKRRGSAYEARRYSDDDEARYYERRHYDDDEGEDEDASEGSGGEDEDEDPYYTRRAGFRSAAPVKHIEDGMDVDSGYDMRRERDEEYGYAVRVQHQHPHPQRPGQHLAPPAAYHQNTHSPHFGSYGSSVSSLSSSASSDAGASASASSPALSLSSVSNQSAASVSNGSAAAKRSPVAGPMRSLATAKYTSPFVREVEVGRLRPARDF